jgi:hypothetical protein
VRSRPPVDGAVADSRALRPREREKDFLEESHDAPRSEPFQRGIGATPLEARASAEATIHTSGRSAGDQHLRSAHEVAGYHIHAQDGEIGHVEDFLVSDDTWTIRYLLVDTSKWIGGRTVLLPPELAQRIDWTRQMMHVDVTREFVKESPEYDPGAVIDRTHDERLADFYGRRPVRPI